MITDSAYYKKAGVAIVSEKQRVHSSTNTTHVISADRYPKTMGRLSTFL